MPPPELFERAAPASVGSLVLEQIRAEAPMSRHTGPRAEEAHLRARLVDARAAEDAAAERELSISLARVLAARGRDLGAAVELARRALAIAEDPALRVELAGWLSGLGDPGAAAGVLRPLAKPSEARAERRASDPPPLDAAGAARTLVKIAVLHARGGDAAAAAEALDEASSLDGKDAMAVELFATLASWASATVTPEGAASAYLEAARRRAEAGDAEAAYEDRLRAFEIAPHDPAAAEAMSEALAGRGLAGAADEVMRLHVASLADTSEVGAAHRRRMLLALRDGDAARAVGAMLDAGLEGEVVGVDAEKVDEALSLAGLYELLAARLEARAERQTGEARSETYQALAKLCAGPLASPERSIEAWIEALASDAGNTAAITALREHASALHDPAPLAEALIRAGSTEGEGRVTALRELFALAEDKVGDATLATWAFDTLVASGHGGDVVIADKLGLVSRQRRQDEELAAAKRAREGADSADARVKALRRLQAAYQGRPAEVGELVRVLVELARELPAERTVLIALERAARRSGDEAPLEEVLRERVASQAAKGTSASSRVEIVRARLALAAIARRRGGDERALADVLPLLAEAPGHRGAASATLLFATRAGRPRARADALVQIAGPAWPALRAVLLAAAAELYQREGAHDLARRTAEQACEADPTCARALATLSSITETSADRVGAAAVERAMTTVLPRGVWCSRLARAFDALSEPALAYAWTQRWLALHPGSAEAMVELLRRAAAARDVARIGDAIGWVLAQPRPLADLAGPVADAIFALLDLDRPKARALGRRALDVIGPRVPALRARLVDLAARSQDPGLAIAVLERWLAAESLGERAGELLVDLARRRTDAGDYDGAARELARAAELASDPNAVLTHAGALEAAMREAGAWLGSDGLVAIAEAKALSLAALGPEHAGAAAMAYRELGSLRWDLGEDPNSAEAAFFRACELSPVGGVERYARDMSAFGGVHEAIESLLLRAEHAEGDALRKVRANLLIEAANLCTEHGMPERALGAAASAIEIDPARADAVALVEKNAHVEGGLAVLDRTYDRLAEAALGCYGRRAAHYRGARQLERRGATDLALRHAAACFEAVPSEGTSYVLLARLSERAGDPTEAVRALERVADAADPGMRPVWLKRAAQLAGSSDEGVRMRFDLLLRALNARPDPSTVEGVAGAVREIRSREGGGSEAMETVRLRCERALNASMKKLDGPDGARAAVSMALLAIELGAIPLAFSALERAMNADGDIDEYASVADRIPALLTNPDAARAWIERVRAVADKPYSSVGTALLRFAAKVASGIADSASHAALLLQAVRRAPEDDALVEEADLAITEHGDAELGQKLDALVSPEARAASLLRLAEERERAGHDTDAIAALERAIATRLLDADTHARAAASLQRLLDRSGRDEDAEFLLRSELSRGSLPPTAHARVAHDLVDLLLRRDDRQGAFEVLAALASEGGPPDPDLLSQMRGLARATGDLGRYADVLASALTRADDDRKRIEILRELAPLLFELGDSDHAAARYEEIAQLDPGDLSALEVLESFANERGDNEAIATLLGRRAAVTPPGDKRRMLRLRRAAVLEQRLGRLDEAAAELATLLAEIPGDQSAMRFLADVHERRGAPLQAAALLVELGALASTSDEKADYGLRAATAYLSGGEVEQAERTLEGVAAIAPPESVIELRVEISRAIGDHRGLAEALEQLSASSREPAERRASFLLEAARAASAAGDDATALERARRALKLAPSLPDAVLEARRLEYKSGGAGTPREAQAAVDDLMRIESRLDPAQVELHAFLLAEELDVIQGGGAGLRELSRRHAELGPLPLVALGMAERMVRAKNFEAALPLFERALEGDLRGLRSRGRVALAAAEAAVNGQAFTLATQLYDVAAGEPETQLIAQRKQLELAASLGEPQIARQALEELLRQATGLDRARVLLQLGKLLEKKEPDTAARLLADAAPLASADRALQAQIADATARLEARNEVPEAETPVPSAVAPALVTAPPETNSGPPPLPSQAKPSDPSKSRVVAVSAFAPSSSAVPPPLPSAPPSSTTPQVIAAQVSATPPSSAAPPPLPSPVPTASPSPPSRSAPPPLPSAPPPLTADTAPRSRVSSDPPRAGDDTEEQRLQRELSKGSFEAGDALIALYGARAVERAPDVLAVRRQQALLRLGDRAALGKLVEAAVLDGNAAYGRAVEHVLHVVDDGTLLPAAPPLTVQRLAPDLVAALLFRSVADSAVHEALALVLDTGLYRRDVGQYQLTGVARVQPGGGSMLGEVYGVVARYLGQARTALFHQRAATAGAASFKIALLSPPAVVMTGEVREETPELRYLLGAALTGAMPEHALVNALGEDGLRTLVDALHAAFGPIANLPRGNAAVARLGQNLWQLVPPRADRRLRELCTDLSSITSEAAIAGTRQAMRRAGLFASGSLATALAQLASEIGVSLATYQRSPDGLARACAAHPEIADLVRLAIRTEFAEARWAAGTPQDRRRADGGAGPRSQRWDLK